MESYIQISKINDFTFCPRSLYFHGLYEPFHKSEYQEAPQIEGTIRHKTIDEGSYSTRKDILTGLPVYSEEFHIAGKIDIFDKKKGHLIERKTFIEKIYDGYRFQLYAQYFALIEMGYEVKKLFLHSLKDNKRYEINLPSIDDVVSFKRIINEIESYDVIDDHSRPLKSKCEGCIYRNLCDHYVVIV